MVKILMEALSEVLALFSLPMLCWSSLVLLGMGFLGVVLASFGFSSRSGAGVTPTQKFKMKKKKKKFFFFFFW